MSRRRNVFTLMAIVLAGSVSGTAFAQGKGPGPDRGKVDYPRLRASLQEMREARRALRDANDAWPRGYRERALQAIDDAINSVKAILQVKDVDTFRGVDRNPDYYKRYRDHPQLRSALEDLREGRAELVAARADVGNLKEQALDDIDVAIGDILTLLRYKRTGDKRDQ